MPAIQRISERRARVGLVAYDGEDRPVVIVGAWERERGPILLAATLETVGAIRGDIPFAMLANPETLTVYRKDRTRSLDPVATISTREILDFYSRGGAEHLAERASAGYTIAMIDAWLGDFMRHWKSPTPPASEAITALGLTPRLESFGRTKREVRLACLPVRRDQLPIELRDGEEYWNERDRRESAHVPPADLP